jgi:hypothetical protein
VSESGYDNCRKEQWRRTTQFEPDKTIQKWLCSQAKKPYDENVGGLLCEKNRDDKKPLELFLAGVQSWEAGLRRKLDCGTSSPC